MIHKWNRHDLPIGEAIYITRTQLGLSHSQIAAQTGVHRNTISRLEKGECGANVAVLMLISHALGMEFSSMVKRAEFLRPAQSVVRKL